MCYFCYWWFFPWHSEGQDMQASGMLMGKEPWLTSNHVGKRFSPPLMPKHSSVVKWRNLDFSTAYCPSKFLMLLKCLSKSTARNLGYLHMEFWSQRQKGKKDLYYKRWHLHLAFAFLLNFGLRVHGVEG